MQFLDSKIVKLLDDLGLQAVHCRLHEAYAKPQQDSIHSGVIVSVVGHKSYMRNQPDR